MPYHKWTLKEREYVRLHYGQVSKAELAETIGVSVSSIYNILKKERKSKDRWSEEQDRLLRGIFKSNGGSIKDTAKKMGRSYHAVEARLRKLGIQKRRRARLWPPEEIDFLCTLIGEPMAHIESKFNTFCKANGQTGRSRASIDQKIRELGESARADNYYNVSTLATFLHCDRNDLKQWILAHKDELRPQQEGRQLLVHRKKLRKFFIAYPGEIERFAPQLTWLIELIASKD
jgi:hypothetical protein